MDILNSKEAVMVKFCFVVVLFLVAPVFAEGLIDVKGDLFSDMGQSFGLNVSVSGAVACYVSWDNETAIEPNSVFQTGVRFEYTFKTPGSHKVTFIAVRGGDSVYLTLPFFVFKTNQGIHLYTETQSYFVDGHMVIDDGQLLPRPAIKKIMKIFFTSVKRLNKK